MRSTRIKEVCDAVLPLAGDNVRLAEPAEHDLFTLHHAKHYIDLLYMKAPKEDGEEWALDGETIMNRHTLRALELSVGGACQAVDLALSGEADKVFVLGYAGHHARHDRAVGFCFTNSVAIAARYAINKGVSRVAVLDFDTHSGCGTALGLMENENAIFAETYQAGFPGHFLPGYVPANLHRRRVDSPFEFSSAWDELLQKVVAYNPELVIVSAGFDAHLADPLGVIGLTDSDYVALTKKIRDLFPRVVACLEGGYDEKALPRCAALFYQHLTAQ